MTQRIFYFITNALRNTRKGPDRPGRPCPNLDVSRPILYNDLIFERILTAQRVIPAPHTN